MSEIFVTAGMKLKFALSCLYAMCILWRMCGTWKLYVVWKMTASIVSGLREGRGGGGFANGDD